jgi:hypothetical protein
MALKALAAGLCAALIMATAFAVPPADARARKDWRYDSWQHQDSWQRYDAQPAGPARQGGYTGGTLSLDGRNTGQPRTCGYDYFQYDFRGATMGPYCH